ncbi:TetR family transcriptional regulator C-terminal domain-containing protein [Halomonas elongata]|uniref:TetR/AcrR family transcriptional regulator n=1 Tax=Halomonas elongata TaxID=2746 RepID=UPI00186B8C9C|nr:TetR family transcriptional regulator C-terminal domain-containing protein [Halomonas elongata]MBW5798946.1 TetR family transcriptional regulator C-terminal domain-containing protein [Halomonas elongata]WVI72966.1 TetR family transcriptional regulator C-terminal domain-containing protein [Halomonas elongata]
MATRRAGNDRESVLIDATLTCIAREGISAATVRNIADYAGVTNGLIRFYFKSKDGILQAAYRRFLERLFEAAHGTIDGDDMTACERLERYLLANLSPPIVTPDSLLLWANFLPLTHHDNAMADIRRHWYDRTTRAFRDLIHEALKEHGHSPSDTELQRLSIAVNGLIDGLWIEGALSTGSFDIHELQAIGLDAAARLLDIPLSHSSA